MNICRFLYRHCFLFVVTSTLFYPYQVYGQNIIVNETEVEHLDVMLSNNTVTAIFQDHTGFIWFGTYNGLNRFDGVNIKKFYSDPNDTNSLTNTYIQDICADRSGNIWVATNNGLNRFDANTENFRQYLHDPSDPNSISSGNLTDIHLDSRGRLWIIGDLISLYDQESDQFENFKIGTSNVDEERADSYNRIFEDSRGGVWFPFNKEIYYYAEEQNSMRLFFDGNKHPLSDLPWYFMNIVQVDEENFWLSAYNAGIISARLYQSDSLEAFSGFTGIEAAALKEVQLLEMIKDSQDRIWISAENQGVYVFNTQGRLIKRFVYDRDNPSSISFNSIWSIFEDNAGRFWLGTWQSGVDVIDKYYRKFTHIHYKPGINSLSHDIVKDILEDELGNLYIATDGGGLNYYNRSTGRFSNYVYDPDVPNSLSANAALALEFDDRGRIWTGTWNGGVSIFDPRTRQFESMVPSNSQLCSPNVFDIVFDGSTMYIGTWGGGLCLYNISTGKWKSYAHDPDNPASLCSNYIYSLFLDSKENLWIGTKNGLDVLAVESQGVFEHFRSIENDTTSISDNTINTIYEDPFNSIWIGTVGGLDLYYPETKQFERINKHDGLIDENISSIIYDGTGYYWLGSNRGLLRFDKENMEFRAYDLSDGMQGYEYSRNTSVLLSTGEIALGGTNGMNIFQPEQIAENPRIPKVVFTDFKIFNMSVPVGENSQLKQHINNADEIVLNYKQNVFTIEFVALNFTHPEKNRYAYIMEGFDDDWIYVTNELKATYTNLSPGEYRFRVKASNNDNIWNEEDISVRVIIEPPLWAANWFRILVGLSLLSLGLLIFLWRTRKLRRSKTELERRVAQATEEVKARNSRLEEAQNKINSIISEVRNNLGEASNKLLDASNKQASALQEITSAIDKMTQDISDNNHESKEIISNSKTVLEEASASMGTVEEAVGFIEKVSKEVSYILEVALQTRLLSLNAAIEAARAGEYGKSFAVVANDVKKLSDRSQIVANNINDLTNSGLKLSNEANAKIKDLPEYITSIVDGMSRIHESIENQSRKAEGINETVKEMSGYIVRTGKLIQELDAAITSLTFKDESA